MPPSEKIANAAANEIKRYFGEYAGKLYLEHYLKQQPHLVFVSLEELLTEAIGPEKAASIVSEVKKQTNEQGKKV
jgi:hypothetical protein